MEIAMTLVKAAGVQLSPVLYSREGTVDKVVRKIHELGQEGVQFATFPETVVILVDERADGVHLSYDSMASLLGPYGSQAALLVARDLDAKIESLLEAAAH
jgi:hypothetical protein